MEELLHRKIKVLLDILSSNDIINVNRNLKKDTIVLYDQYIENSLNKRDIKGLLKIYENLMNFIKGFLLEDHLIYYLINKI